jgi:two-component system response regulator MtrA
MSMTKKRILIVEDDAPLARILRDNLAMDGFDTQCVSDGDLAIGVAREYSPDLVLLDIVLPGKNGFELFSFLSQGGRTPIIVLSARAQRDDKLRGLNIGADDYVTKPFDTEELLARIHAVLRRARPSIDRLTFGRITIDCGGLKATYGRRAVHLTRREFDLLRYLAERPGRVVYRSELLQEVWGYPEDPITRSVDHAVMRLRKKLERDPHHPQFILTAHGGGYCLATDPSGSDSDEAETTDQQ